MKKVITMLALLALVSSLCTGCKKDTDQPKPETTQQSEAQAEEWEPETAEDPADDHDQSHDGHDHTGHNH